MFSAQAHLADAYIAAGAAAEARFIAEDLVAREPWERSNVERFRAALVLLGEPDPDAIIADRLSGQTPFTTTDLTIAEITEFPDGDAPAAPPPTPHVEAAGAAQPSDSKMFELSTNAIDLDAVLGDLEQSSDEPEQRIAEPGAGHAGDDDEVDL